MDKEGAKWNVDVLCRDPIIKTGLEGVSSDRWIDPKTEREYSRNSWIVY